MTADKRTASVTISSTGFVAVGLEFAAPVDDRNGRGKGGVAGFVPFAIPVSRSVVICSQGGRSSKALCSATDEMLDMVGGSRNQ